MKKGLSRLGMLVSCTSSLVVLALVYRALKCCELIPMLFLSKNSRRENFFLKPKGS